MDGGGIALPLFIVFLVLKLTHVIGWSWWWVTAPIWIDVALTVALGALFSFVGISVFARLRGGRK